MDANDFVIKNGVLKKYKGPGGNVILPEGLQKIGDRVFKECINLTGITLPEGLLEIGKWAFDECTNLTSITLPEGLLEIGEWAFNECTNLRSIILPHSLKKIGDCAFLKCANLNNITFPDGLNEIGTWAFSKCITFSSIVIPKCLQEIAAGAFSGCTNLRSVILPEGLQKIGYNSFSDCENLTGITLPEGVQTIGEKAFSGCTNLSSIILTEGLQAIGEKAFFGCKNLSSIILPEGVQTIGENAFSGCTNLSSITLPEGLQEIGDSAFSDCTNLSSINLPKGLKEIGRSTFSGCTNLSSISLPEGLRKIEAKAFFGCANLSSITLPESLQIIECEAFSGCENLSNINLPESLQKIGVYAFSGCEKLCKEIQGITYVDTWIIKCNEDVVETKILPVAGIADKAFSCCTNLRSITLSEGLKTIGKGVFEECNLLSSIILPESLQTITDDIFSPCFRLKDVNKPDGYFHQSVKLPVGSTYSLITGVWKDKITVEDYVYLYLFQSGKDINRCCVENLKKEPENSAQTFIRVLKYHKSSSCFVKAAEFIYENKEEISQKTIDEFYMAAAESKANKAIKLIKPIVSEDNTQNISGNDKKKNKKGSPVPTRDIEIFCSENFSEYYLDKSIKTIVGLKHKIFDKVLYKDSKVHAPDFIAKCAIVPYMDLMDKKAKNISSYKTDYLRVKFLENSDKVAAELDLEAFISVMEKYLAANSSIFTDSPQILIPLCRFGTEKNIKMLEKLMKDWGDWYKYGAKGRTSIIVARGAIMLNDSREAMLYAEKNKCLRFYAGLRGMDEESFRDTKLSDFGLDKDGKKTFDLGNTKIEVSVNQDLSLNIYNIGEEKFVKSVPKKDADPEKYEFVSENVEDMKKNIKKVIKTRNDKLFEMFLYGSTKKATNWKASYLNNPVLHRVAELIVWHQENNTFILSKDGPVDSVGNVYEIRDDIVVGVAHPMQMTKTEISSWQNYFNKNNLKQPFEQIWEPVIEPETIKTDRYAGIMIPFYRFKNQGKIGITVYDNDFHDDITVTFEGCKADVERIDLTRHQINMNDRFEIKTFSTNGIYSRKINHLVAYLDRITVYDRIKKDDVTIESQLPNFTFAQITEFINIASENNCTNVTALLLNYKNENFADFEPMDEFVLGDL